MKKKYRVAGIGELLWDILPSGKQAGGAPFNFAYHAGQAECESYVFSAVGRDDLGKKILLKVNQLGIDGSYIQRNSYPTGTVTVRLNKEGHPDYTIHERVAWDYLQWDNDMRIFAGKLDAVCFGSLAQRASVSAQTIRSFLTALNSECLKVFDINLRQNYFNKEMILESIGISDVLKMNDEELPVISGYLGLYGEIRVQLHQLLHRYSLKCIVYTMGSNGSILMTPNDYSFLEAPKVKVADTVGAGDAFTATLVAGLLQKISLPEIHKKATEIAALVCTRKGATPVMT